MISSITIVRLSLYVFFGRQVRVHLGDFPQGTDNINKMQP